MTVYIAVKPFPFVYIGAASSIEAIEKLITSQYPRAIKRSEGLYDEDGLTIQVITDEIDEVHDAHYYIEAGKKILPTDKWQKWEEIVDYSMKGVYSGSDLKAVLELIPLKDNLAKAREVFNRQDHTGFSASLVYMELKELLDDGEAFAKALINQK